MNPLRTRIKICGVRSFDAIDAAVEAGADALGFVFVKQSPRYIEPEKALPLVLRLPPMITSVALFQNCDLDTFCDIEEQCPTHLSQLHGDEPPKLVQQCGPGVIKSVRFDPATIAAHLDTWNAIDEVDAILIDGSAGGQGKAFDWTQLLPHLENITKPIIIAGGLTPDNVADAIATIRPYAVDVSSGVESRRGVKDPARIRAFCQAVHDADRTR